MPGKPRVRRYHVATRPKIVRRQRMAVVVAAAMLGLGALAVVTFQHFHPALREFWARMSVPAEIRLEGVPAAWDRQVRSFMESQSAEASSQIEPLLKAFPIFRSVRARRSWLKARITFHFELQRAVASLPDGRCLGETGAVFQGPQEGCGESLPVVNISGAGLQELKSLGAALADAEAAEGGGLSFLKMNFASSAEGWKATLKDGTEVRWGGLSWTPEKLQRLHQALEDARKSQPGMFNADLRYFEDGKIILRRVK